MLLTLMVVAIGLSLAATESRDERDVLLTVGAATLAIPTGVVPVLAVVKAAPDDNQITFMLPLGDCDTLTDDRRGQSGNGSSLSRSRISAAIPSLGCRP